MCPSPRTFVFTLTLTFVLASTGCGDDASRASDAAALPLADASDDTSSGVPRTLSLSELDARQIQQFCEWSLDVQGGPHQRAFCEDGTEIDSGNVTRCVEGLNRFSDCIIEVGEMEDCSLAMSADLCAAIDHPACLPVRACGMMPRL